MSTFALDNPLDLSQLLTIGSTLEINSDYNDLENDLGNESEPDRLPTRGIEFIGEPVSSFKQLELKMVPLDKAGRVKKKCLEEGGGFPLNKNFTLYVAFTGYWENTEEPFDMQRAEKPMIVDLNDNGLLPGLQIAIESMLVGETSVFLLSHEVMYGELGIPPRIKPKATCVFYIKLIRAILTPKEGKLNFSEPNNFQRVLHEVKKLYSSGVTLHRIKSYNLATKNFQKAVRMLHRCRLADAQEELKQESMLKKLYFNLAVSYNLMKQPLRACTACNELNRLRHLWNNAKALLQNAKALRMIGQFDAAEKRLLRAIDLCPDVQELKAELELLQKTRESQEQYKRLLDRIAPSLELITEQFKQEVDHMIIQFKANNDLCKLMLPGDFTAAEMEYIREACLRESLFCNKVKESYALDKEPETSTDNIEDLTVKLEDYKLSDQSTK